MSDHGPDDRSPPPDAQGGAGDEPPPPPGGWGQPHDPNWGPASGGRSAPVSPASESGSPGQDKGGERSPASPALDLRPWSVGELLDGTVRTLLRNWRVLLAAVALVYVPVQLLFVAVAPEIATTGPLDAFTEGFEDPQAFEQELDAVFPLEAIARAQGFLLVQSLIVSPFIAGVVVAVVVADRLGSAVGVGAALRRAASRLHVLVAVRLIIAAAAFGALVAVGAIIALLLVGTGPLGLLIAIPLFLATGAGIVAALTLVAAVTPAIVVEQRGPIQAITRSVRLVNRRYWPTLGRVLLVALLVGIASQVLSLLALPTDLLPGNVAFLAASTLVEIVLAPLLPTALALIYLDLRVRTEGLDLYADLNDPTGPDGLGG